jgi:predicted HTH domain antitoxin
MQQEQPWAPLEELVPADIFKAEVLTWAKRIGVEPKEIHIRPMKRKWASCSSKGRLTFDEGLLRQPAAFRSEVIVHELLHLKVPNHGPLFRTLLRAYLDLLVTNSKSQLEQLAQEALLVKLYAQGEISSGYAAQVLGVSRRQFLDLLGHYGVSIFADDTDVAQEAQYG